MITTHTQATRRSTPTDQTSRNKQNPRPAALPTIPTKQNTQNARLVTRTVDGVFPSSYHDFPSPPSIRRACTTVTASGRNRDRESRCWGRRLGHPIPSDRHPMRVRLHLLQHHESETRSAWQHRPFFSGRCEIALDRSPPGRRLLRVDLQRPRRSHFSGGFQCGWQLPPVHRPTRPFIVLLARHDGNVPVCIVRHVAVHILYSASPDHVYPPAFFPYCVSALFRPEECRLFFSPRLLIKFARSTVSFPTGFFWTVTIKCEDLSLSVNVSSHSVHSPELLAATSTSTSLSSTPSSTAGSLPPASASSTSKSNVPAIAGGVVGGVVAVILCVALLVLRMRRRPSRLEVMDKSMATSPFMMYSRPEESASGSATPRAILWITDLPAMTQIQIHRSFLLLTGRQAAS